ncbi:DNA translocase FtsK [Candidatus Profftella armatura (Diaphorina cf. continua)]|uniref:DNA translocase FtsK n=1 Tax=Candidatus Profftella armatura (Diaphorina cf. continua) TaxID=2661583 RepID=A0A7R6VYS0_9PROT|nr:DNA translocase FtsK [Candidatus Profftella armatura (Diaphorina cf. continua)]BCG49514.1 DNA translocase FtsK [Candidatus Profftella armatura (Diaphorina cf. continua)]
MLKNFYFAKFIKYLLIFIGISIIFFLNIFLLRTIKIIYIFLKNYLFFFFVKKNKILYQKKNVSLEFPNKTSINKKLPINKTSINKKLPINKTSINKKLPINKTSINKKLPINKTSINKKLPINKTSINKKLPINKTSINKKLPINKTSINKKLPINKTSINKKLPINKTSINKKLPINKTSINKKLPINKTSINKKLPINKINYTLPPLFLLDKASKKKVTSIKNLKFIGNLIEKKLSDFGIQVKVVMIHSGPVITCYEIELAVGIKGSQIINLSRDLARSLSLTSLRVIEIIPGTNHMGIELPNPKRKIVRLIEIFDSDIYKNSTSKLTIALGKNIIGNPVIINLEKMSHILISGTTGSGKSIAINAIILSILYKSYPSDVKLILIDPKMLELSIYKDIPHLLTPVITNMKKVSHILNWTINEMEQRYQKMSKLGVRNLFEYNKKIFNLYKNNILKNKKKLELNSTEYLNTLPSIIIIIDELADLIMIDGKNIEKLIVRISQKARAAGIHLILATQRPSVNIITGLIKANIPTRIAFKVNSKIDSRTILDQIGAEKLLGKGDMLYLSNSISLIRIHGAFVSNQEVEKVIKYLKKQEKPSYIKNLFLQ